MARKTPESGYSGRKAALDESAEQAQMYDPALANLFSSSLGPLKPVLRSLPLVHPSRERLDPIDSDDAPIDSNRTRESRSASRADLNDHLHGRKHSAVVHRQDLTLDQADLGNRQGRKRKRKEPEDDLEGRYMRQLADEDIKEDKKRTHEGHKSHGVESATDFHSIETFPNPEKSNELESGKALARKKREALNEDSPQHETISISKGDRELEKSSRTVFLANVSTMAIKSKSAKKTLLEHLASFVPSLPQESVKHGVESIRFRSTAFTSTGAPKKAAYAKKELMDTTTKSTNAYAVYTTQLASREAIRSLNGTIVLDRHLRVDSVAHPAKQENWRCVFVGNLGFVDDESAINAAADEDSNKRIRKAKEPADIEEGLWRQFGKAGIVESVRVVRDKTTRVGKGFAYVQYMEPNAVEKALLYNEKKYPPMLPRILRVTRAKSLKSAAPREKSNLGSKRENPSLAGRARKLLGRAGAAEFKARQPTSRTADKASNSAKHEDSIVFEGYRASQTKSGSLAKKHKKPSERSSAFKAQESREGQR